LIQFISFLTDKILLSRNPNGIFKKTIPAKIEDRLLNVGSNKTQRKEKTSLDPFPQITSNGTLGGESTLSELAYLNIPPP